MQSILWSLRSRRGAAMVLTVILMSGPVLAEEAGLKLPDEGYDEPLELIGSRPVVSVFVGDRGPYTFVLDAGSGLNAIDSGLAKELGLKVVGEQEVGAPGVSPVAADVVELEGLRFGGVEIGPGTAVTVNLAEMSGNLFVGVLSIHSLAGTLVTFDYAGGRLRVSSGGLDPAQPGVIPFDFSERGPISVPIEIGSKTIPAHIDTGSPGGITIPRQLADDLPLLGEPVGAGSIGLVGATGKLWDAVLEGTVSIGAIRLRDPEIRLTDLPIPAANIGGGFLRDRVLRIDMGNGLLALEAAAKVSDGPGPERQVRRVAASPASGRRTLGLRIGAQGPPGPNGLPLVDGALRVGGVEPGSLADRAGLREGDFLVSVNERPLAELNAQALREIFGGSEPLRLEIRRGETTRRVLIE